MSKIVEILLEFLMQRMSCCNEYFHNSRYEYQKYFECVNLIII